MGDCLTIGAANDFLVKDQNRIQGTIAQSLAINDVWMNVLETSTFPSGVSDIQRSVVQEAIAPVLSQATPNWTTFSCSRVPSPVQTGTTTYSYSPLSHFERGPKICVTQAFSAFKGAIKATENSIVDHVATLWTSFIRYQLYYNSATKITVNSTKSFNQMVARGFQTAFPTGFAPNAALTFNFLKAVANYARNVLLAGARFQFGSGAGMHVKFISDQSTVDSMRAQADVRSDLRYIAAGGFKEAKDALMEYVWEGPYQGIAFGVDQSITRASGFNTTTGIPTFVEPFAAQAATIGVKRVFTDAWLNAPYQISYIIAKGSFIREIPEEFLGEGMTRFDKQFWGGKVVWHNQQDNDCNIKGDTGFHYYDLAAAIRPERPEFVIPILHTRCVEDFGLTACTPQGYYTLSV